ncbi:1-acyl-sn-glycerol-3-phosphate acyltransferase [Alicyclobacillus mali]|uniref:1-acyl-sn-glycerol-3-phosphate acyltransferase n=2 Tax=Alicyclobacillus mali (ex Roth et al. 2021) TaxID=1123961 RepID=A0ABS0EZC7_9BACL|nr:lysophospholipid acyltransferase family protein [Alicyclobacillus mali (ex Roth et al. 2021)]MBF8376392.1 1-acyl-sn-glycerol-3-phosphate acyltransferase [Alicyclobacillus mali (ex Roth et al. 2021)]MCL6488906.1 1-acyl-sn-glycerol-3-phosphate acyltransferase [Alicyclobacillus mali (ex Roth et al. 2021)]
MSVESSDLPRTFFYRFARAVVTAFFRACFRVRVEGLQRLPRQGGVVLASNHLSNFDPPLLGILVPRYIRFMGKAELFRMPMLRRLFLTLGGFPIERGRVDRRAIRTAIDVLQRGTCLVMFPEGHRSRTGKLGPLQPGIASIARKAGAIIQPVGIRGQYRLFGRIEVKFGEPIDVRALSDEEVMRNLREQLLRLTGSGSDMDAR